MHAVQYKAEQDQVIDMQQSTTSRLRSKASGPAAEQHHGPTSCLLVSDNQITLTAGVAEEAAARQYDKVPSGVAV